MATPASTKLTKNAVCVRRNSEGKKKRSLRYRFHFSQRISQNDLLS
ncbi:hypothetical protein LTSEMON_3288 [Salmonella enterica subsp. enterica serovar Montevideo str. S5-403]|uniref:Uncharacterized protein n=1 Tax=Salmonella enterica subsp. enterica serovar Montevideo str. S5-403 TaxID=913242 RepID=G5Q575_SALMO|nr:hypothetical protein LTSEMON_3288 [Salmonella enterica subsp. enterica serovar Montevideo str. S5-403]